MPVLSKLPRGLTSLLSLRDLGATPKQLADVVAGIVDFTPLYLLDTRERTATFSNNAPAVGANSFTAPGAFLVPAGELWYVWQYICVVSPGAATAINLAPAVSLDGAALYGPVGDYQAVAALESGRAFSKSNFWAGPGSDFGFAVKSITGAPGTVSGAAVITRLRI